MAKRLGNDYLLWIKGAANTYALVKGQQSISISRDAGSIDTTTKDDSGYGTSAPGLKSLKISLDTIPNLPDATGYTALETKCNAAPAVPFDIQIRKGGQTGTEADAVFEGSVYGNITSTEFGQNDAVKAKVEFSAAAAPVKDVLGYLILRKLDTISGQIHSYAWFLRPYVGAAREGQTSWNPYSVGRASPVLLGTVARVKDTTDALARADAAFAERAQSIEASLSTVDTRIAAKATDLTRAFTDGDTALATRATTLEAAASAASTSIVFNDNFNFWPDGRNLPSRWSVWVAEGNFRTNRLSPGRGGGQYCVQTLNDVADVASGFVQTIYTAGAGKWVIEVTAGFDTSGARGAGVTLHGIWNIDFCSDPDINGLIGDRPGETRSWTKMVDLDGRDQINVHAMHGWGGFGRGMAAKYMVWHRLALRPATDGEIKAGKADATLNGPGGVLARITANEATIADLPNRYAAATRTATLEAQLRGEVASGLGDTIGAVNGRIDTSNTQLTARIEDRATAIADAKAGAVAQTVSQLRTEYNQTAADLTVVAGVASDAYGRSRAFLRQEAVAGNNRAQISIYADSNSGAGVEIVGDVLISGNLLVTGTVNTTQITAGAVSSSFAADGPNISLGPNGQATSVGGTVRTSSTSAVRVEWKCQSTYQINAGSGSGACYCSVFRIVGGTETEIQTSGLPRGGTQATAWIIDFPPEGDVRYELRFRDYMSGQASYNWTISFITIGVIGLKR